MGGYHIYQVRLEQPYLIIYSVTHIEISSYLKDRPWASLSFYLE